MADVGGPVRLQPLVRARVATLGDEGRVWVEALPALLDDLCRRWSLRLGRRLPGGSASYLTTVLRADGSEAVLKVALPEPEPVRVGQVAAALATADGQGCVRLLEAEPRSGALLLERLGPSLDRSGLTVEAQLDALAATLQVTWRAPDRAPSDRARSLAVGIRTFHTQLPGSTGTGVVEHALACAAVLAVPDPADLVVVHGDPHPGNLLRVRHPRPGAETGWCFVDPDPFVAERAYDLGVAVRDFSSALLAEPETAVARAWSWCVRVAAASGADPGRVWAWGFLERVSTGLYVTSFGAPRVGEPFLRSAALLLEHEPSIRRADLLGSPSVLPDVGTTPSVS